MFPPLELVAAANVPQAAGGFLSIARNVPNAQERWIFQLTAMGRLHMFRALPDGALQRRLATRESVAQLVEQLTFNQ
jgi:hypothetical protein